jgi:hypothetical protein
MMYRRLNNTLLIASTLVLALCFWHRNDIPGKISFHAGLESAPLQRKLDKAAFPVTFSGVEYRIEPQYDYELYGLVVSFRQHDGTSRMHRLSNDHLNMADICVVWSDTAFSESLGKLRFWNGIFTCNVSTRDADAWSRFKSNQLSNNHLISADSVIRDHVADIAIGDQIHIRGWLSRYGAVGGPVRGTSTTREDTGDGACETIYVNDFEIIRPASNRWRNGMYISLVLLLVGLAIHFALPYRPYRS